MLYYVYQMVFGSFVFKISTYLTYYGKVAVNGRICNSFTRVYLRIEECKKNESLYFRYTTLQQILRFLLLNLTFKFQAR